MLRPIDSNGPILVGVDFSLHCLAALRTALRLAHADGRSVQAVHVIESIVVDDFADATSLDRNALAEDVRRDAESAWRQFIASVPECEGVRFDAVIGHRVQSLLAAERALSPSLVVLGARGTSGAGPGPGSTATAAVRKCKSNVLLVRGEPRPFSRVMAGIDFSPTSRHALREAIRIAQTDGATLHALHVFNGPWHILHYRSPTPEADPRIQKQYRDALANRLASLVAEEAAASGSDLHITSSVIDQQSVNSTLLDQAAANGADLLVIGRRGRANIRDFLLGSTAERILRELETSLLAVRAAD